MEYKNTIKILKIIDIKKNTHISDDLIVFIDFGLEYLNLKNMKIVNKETNKTNENKSELVEVFALWNKKSQNGIDYQTGTITIDNKKYDVVMFINHKTNDSQPDFRIYTNVDNKRSDESIISLWKTTSKTGMNYLSGLDNENKKIIAFYNNKTSDNQPDIIGYYK